MPSSSAKLETLNARIIACDRCARLRSHCADVARMRRRAYMDWEYWGRPVPSFGDPNARVLALGLAPGAHGSNRTGRPFTGDGSGDFLYPVLHEAGFASQTEGHIAQRWHETHRICGSVRWSAARRRATSPRPRSMRNCAPWLDEEFALFATCASSSAWAASLSMDCSRTLQRTGSCRPRSGYAFRHGAEYTLPGGLHVIASFHPSLQNTNTGRLTRPMFLAIFKRARRAGRAAKTPDRVRRKIDWSQSYG